MTATSHPKYDPAVLAAINLAHKVGDHAVANLLRKEAAAVPTDPQHLPCEGCGAEPHEDCRPDCLGPDAYCDTHKRPVQVVREGGSIGFAGGNITWAEFSCGCTDVDDSSDVQAAR